MKVLLDTNILIHREASRIVNEEIGTLFNWLDRLHYEKYIHPLSIGELEKHSDPAVVKTIQTKIQNYNTLKTEAPESDEISAIREKYDKNENDNIDTSLLKEVYANRIDYLITEDRNIHVKASDLGISNKDYPAISIQHDPSLMCKISELEKTAEALNYLNYTGLRTFDVQFDYGY